jgi:hypothetical protein
LLKASGSFLDTRSIAEVTMTEKKRTRRDLEQAVIKKALRDEAFRKALLKDPKSALESVLAEEVPGSKLPANLEVKAIQEPANGLYIVVPHVPAELSDEDLERVAGGLAADSVEVSTSWGR